MLDDRPADASWGPTPYLKAIPSRRHSAEGALALSRKPIAKFQMTGFVSAVRCA